MMQQSDVVKDIIAGFEEDLSKMVETFPEAYPSLKLIDWFKYWDENLLDCLFANRFDPRELYEAITAMNHYLVQQIIAPQRDLTQQIRWLVALYLLFCVSKKQPARLRRKIRISFDDLVYIENLVRKHEENPSYGKDVKFVWSQLKSVESMDLVEDRGIYGPQTLSSSGAQKQESRAQTQCQIVSELRAESLSFVEQKLEPKLLELSRICGPYGEIKSSLGLAELADKTINDLLNKANDCLAQFRDSLKDS